MREPEGVAEHEGPIPDEAVVVRFGRMARRDLEISFRNHFARYGTYALSVFSLPGRDATETANVGGLPHSQIRQSTVEHLRQAGYDVVPDPSGILGHCLVMMGHEPTNGDWELLEQAFNTAEPNPAGRQ